MATQKRIRRQTTQHVLVRGSRRNPVQFFVEESTQYGVKVGQA